MGVPEGREVFDTVPARRGPQRDIQAVSDEYAMGFDIRQGGRAEEGMKATSTPGIPVPQSTISWLPVDRESRTAARGARAVSISATSIPSSLMSTPSPSGSLRLHAGSTRESRVAQGATDMPNQPSAAPFAVGKQVAYLAPAVCVSLWRRSFFGIACCLCHVYAIHLRPGGVGGAGASAAQWPARVAFSPLIFAIPMRSRNT